MSVVVTGMGIFSSIAPNITDFLAALKSGRTNFSTKTVVYGSEHMQVVGSFLQDFDFKEQLSSRESIPAALKEKAFNVGRRAPTAIQASILSAMDAWLQAGLSEHVVEADRVSVVVAGNNLTNDYIAELHQTYEDSPEYLPPRFILHSMDTDQVGTLSEVFSIKGEGLTTGGASASGNVALIKAFQLILSGESDVALVVGPVSELSPMLFQGFEKIAALGGTGDIGNPALACRPFDSGHDGFIPGQSSACLILESRQSAQARGIAPLAVMLMGKICLDANRQANPSMEGQIRVMKETLRWAGIDARKVNYINAHGTSTPLGDKTELCSIKAIFGSGDESPWINSTKGLTGHCLYSAGVVEAISTILQMQNGFIHPNLNLVNPVDGDCMLAGPQSEPAQIHYSLSNSFGFGGINTSVIFAGPEVNGTLSSTLGKGI
ncbi:beta-ketoacyl synthase N-terminal-like domain-containing protein [Photobacterium sp. 1_MG-2023]|uniref:beta-ketoacyl synthase N-terminal-like domain-containing protein n=1 Tax=Photobacterium sp. 1_MG-2023 TaxID=3062646 RepID=UPI0026E27045|nr:beta-ketoacyl synthase N-terminal-like domain-containing protein [Photobacterium sp. 1_MG-2023]MDO6706107.1 beta-ketoacyl synthase N-terminal-like domain-containing protein [Photobacterium sp. 1_MG-2023]